MIVTTASSMCKPERTNECVKVIRERVSFRLIGV